MTSTVDSYRGARPRVGIDGELALLVAAAHGLVDDALTVDLTRDARDGFLATYRELDRLRNRLAAVEHRVIAEIERRGLPHELGATSTAGLLREQLLIAKGEAFGRVKAAGAAAARTTLTGEPTPAPFVHVAVAQQSGAISPAHARIVVGTLDALPDAVQAEHGDLIEADLVGHATRFDPTGLAKLAVRVGMHYDPDGVLHDHAYRQQHRDVLLTRRADGSGQLRGEVSAELGERLEVLFDALAAPAPELDGVKDRRTAGQRRHDALMDGLELVQRARLLPSVNGVSATVVLHLADEAWRTGRGIAVTGHRAVLPAREAITWAGGDPRVLAVALSNTGEVTAYSHLQRIHTEQQRLAIAARDVGCTFPGCDAPAAWCQVHHLLDFALGGPTTIDNGGLVCARHHRDTVAQGWTATMIDDRPAWIPPPWLDPDRRPRHNTTHDPLRL